MDTIIVSKQCLFCKREIRGRSDKKFCDDQCRNQHNNRSRRSQDGIIRTINRILSKNKRIIERMLGREESRTLHRDKLLQKGFDFTFYTQRIETGAAVRLHIYDTICEIRNGEQVLITRQVVEVD